MVTKQRSDELIKCWMDMFIFLDRLMGEWMNWAWMSDGQEVWVDDGWMDELSMIVSDCQEVWVDGTKKGRIAYIGTVHFSKVTVHLSKATVHFLKVTVHFLKVTCALYTSQR